MASTKIKIDRYIPIEDIEKLIEIGDIVQLYVKEKLYYSILALSEPVISREFRECQILAYCIYHCHSRYMNNFDNLYIIRFDNFCSSKKLEYFITK